jgi:hypothetical protein
MHNRLLLIAVVALAACRSANVVAGQQSAPATRTAAVSPNSHDHVAPVTHDPLPAKELEKARRATARYQDVKNAIADGYKDIDVVLPNMGRHFLKEALLDGTFDAGRPELLVYRDEPGSLLTLVALEYAVPLKVSETPPAGFTGDADTWFSDQRFQLWTLHAWVWKKNPDGVFHATNSLVP